jgi:hypothetical protein
MCVSLPTLSPPRLRPICMRVLLPALPPSPSKHTHTYIHTHTHMNKNNRTSSARPFPAWTSMMPSKPRMKSPMPSRRAYRCVYVYVCVYVSVYVCACVHIPVSPWTLWREVTVSPSPFSFFTYPSTYTHTYIYIYIQTAMSDYGFFILNALLTDLEPDLRVKAAMNEINASKRLKEAARERAEGDKIVQVKIAEAGAESKYLQGVCVCVCVCVCVKGSRGRLVVIVFFGPSFFSPYISVSPLTPVPSHTYTHTHTYPQAWVWRSSGRRSWMG